MLKNKLKIVAIFTTIIFALTLTFSTVLAVDEPNAEGTEPQTAEAVNQANEDPQAPENAEQKDDSVELNNANSEKSNQEDSMKKSDVYITDQDVTIDYVVDGNLFVMANNVTINSQIGGDAFICAKNITIGEQGYVFSNLFALSQSLNINGIVYDVYSGAENVSVKGYVYRDFRVAANTINIAGTIGRNAYIGCQELNFTENDSKVNVAQGGTGQGQITGNLEYSSTKEASIPDGAVTGEVLFNKQTEKTDNHNVIQDKIFELGKFVVTVVLIWLLLLWIAPKFIENNEELITTKKVLPVLGFGILTPIVLAFLTILLLILGLTAKIGLLALIVLVILACISTSIFAITLNSVICNKFKMEKRLIKFGILVATSVVLWIISIIPVIGGILSFAYSVLGLGIIVYKIVPKKEKAVDKK